MKSRKSHLIALVVCTAVLLPVWLAAQRASSDHREPSGHHPRYKLIDLGTLGGPRSYGDMAADGLRLLNNEGVVSATAGTSQLDPHAPNFCFDPDCFLGHAFRWRDGVITDIGALPGVNSSAIDSINERGWSTGFSQTGFVDPVLGPAVHGVLWKRHEIGDLGSFGALSLGIYINNAAQIVGISDSTVPDPFSLFLLGVQMRTFLWDDGKLEDIGTLGGPDASPGAGCNNQRESLIVGQSYTNFTANPSTGMPTLDPFLWKHGKMIDLGTLGGTNGIGQCANNRGEIIGISNLSSDIIHHAFVWDDGLIKDLGTLGGDQSEAIWINDAGEIAGSADLPGSVLHDAVLWKDGVIHDLGTVDGDPCSRGRGINSRGQVVGGSSDCANFLHAFVWEKGGPMLDLNNLVAPDSGLQITSAFDINDRGEILAKSVPLGVTPIDDHDLGHLVLLVPCERDDEKGCEENDHAASTAAPIKPAIANRTTSMPQHPMTARENATAWRSHLAQQYHLRAMRPTN